MDTPDWSDEGLSRDLPILRSRGEGQELEYMQEFPKNTRELAREIAAFATSNTGTILLGVSDSGDLLGLPSASTLEGRDELIRRLEGISRGTVKPAVTPTAKFAVEGTSVVLVLTIPKGKQPVYYSGNTPYVRHLTEARPAEPHEVLELVAEHLAQSKITDTESDAIGQLYSEIARILVEVMVFADQAAERQINPWLDMWRAEFGYSATELRELGAGKSAIEEEIDAELRKVADLLDEVANLRLHLGSGTELERTTAAAASEARRFIAQHIENVPLGETSLDQIRDHIVTSSRKLNDVVMRAENMVEAGRI